MTAKPNTAIILLDRNKLDYFSPENNQIYTYQFPENMVRYAEIVNDKELAMQINLFINYHKLPSARIIYILSQQITLEKNMAEDKTDNQQTMVDEFLYHLPFESNIHKIYKLEKGYLISAVNSTFLKSFTENFTKAGFHTMTVVPASVTGININYLDSPTVGFLLAKTDFLKEQSMTGEREDETHKPKKEPDKVMGLNRIYLLVTVFILLLSFLLFMLYRQSAG
ncbi:MAG: hypothetical protein UV73_C0003G0122 [Candidatus Gottesmanbacteria bacterium GW2011_GWA2_43_14]|uniref:Uncharacterized protein n=1 Tax=Candidatus Gottesmanbacteria bacterium GW2011_GWA2_43_14 TaxID=1618443 RepID=A0A0G1DK16_9BACT|nr:MAG: hypothetical protein UV73_C0003G0122 [Candidatus Gottesmanbacteria bacterium GW2011_GWA2_43_14]